MQEGRGVVNSYVADFSHFSPSFLSINRPQDCQFRRYRRFSSEGKGRLFALRAKPPAGAVGQ
jgi:hypothetical protein